MPADRVGAALALRNIAHRVLPGVVSLFPLSRSRNVDARGNGMWKAEWNAGPGVAARCVGAGWFSKGRKNGGTSYCRAATVPRSIIAGCSGSIAAAGPVSFADEFVSAVVTEFKGYQGSPDCGESKFSRISEISRGGG